MNIHKVLIIRTKNVPTRGLGGYTYNEEHRAYSDYQYFSSMEKAQTFCQKYSHQSLVWEQIGDDCWTSEMGELSFNIYLEKGSMFDTEEMPPLPSDKDLKVFEHIVD